MQFPNSIAQQPAVSAVRRHILVIGSRAGIEMFPSLPSACTGISPSDDWATMHRAWAARSYRGFFNYTLSSGSGQVSVACADFCCISASSGSALSSAAIKALLRPPALSRQAIANPSYVLVPVATSSGADATGVTSSSSDNSHFSTANSASAAAAAANQSMAVPQTVPSRAHKAHAHNNTFVSTTVFIVVDMGDARTLHQARICAKTLDDECQRLNPSTGNRPLFVFVAASVDNKSGGAAGNSGVGVGGFPEVLLRDVVETAEMLVEAPGRVDEVTLVL